MPHPDRRAFLAACSSLGLGHTLFPGTLWTVWTSETPGAEHSQAEHSQAERSQDEPTLTVEMIETAEKVAGLSFTPEQRELMREDLEDHLESYAALRDARIPNDVPPAYVFDPTISGVKPPPMPAPPVEPDEDAPAEPLPPAWTPPSLARPSDEDDLAFLTVAELSGLLRSGQITSVELTRLYLDRLKRFDPQLQAVVTLTEDRAIEQAMDRDRELRAGRWRGPLHGIPWGAKDLLAVPDYPTTWGAMPYRDQVIDDTAEVVRRLDEAGAVLVAKLTLGALAWGDVWFGGTTKNPWNLDEGSSGSSAGPGSAVAAGLVPFAIGSETLGSIVSPSTRNGVTGLRPTFGTVSRHGAMTLCWTLDKLGPMARSAEDCALVQQAIQGKDPRDPSTIEAPFTWPDPVGVRDLRVGYLAEAFDEEYDNQAADRAALDVLRNQGPDLVPFSLPEYPLGAMLLTLDVEAAAAFDALTLDGGVDQLVRQVRRAWPNVFRAARFVPAVEYVQANRLRTGLIRDMAERMADIDVFVSPSFGGGTLSLTNLSGHPCVVVPNAFHPLEDDPESPRRQPGSICFIGGLYKDAHALAVADLYQRATDFHRRRPPMR